MGLFSSREDKIKKLDEDLKNFDDEYTYKKLLDWLERNADSNSSDFDNLAIGYILHHDLQEQNKHLESIEELLKNKK